VPLQLPLCRHGEAGSELTAGQDGGVVVRRSVLPGGIRVLTERMPAMRSATVGAWVGVGSRDERDGHHGSTHFLEHLLFKGTRQRSAMEIAEAFDAVGGEANASTGKEHTCYYARVLDTDVPMAVDVIGDMVTSAALDPGELEIERGVILEELAMNDDDPSDVAHEQFAAAVLGGHPLGRPIGGTPDTIRAVPRDAVAAHYAEHYGPATLVLTAAGSVDHDALCAQVLAAARAGGWALEPDGEPIGRRSTTATEPIPTEGTELTIHRSTEQANVILGGPGLAATDERRFMLSVLTTVLGGGMSSRLFQEIREKRGLAYSVYAFASPHADSGLIGLYAGCAPTKVDEVVDLLVAEWERLAADGITAAELERGIGQLFGNMVLGLEDTGSRMSRLGKAELVHGELLTLTESLERIRAVTAAQVQDLAAELAARPRSVVRVGPFAD
jgi:predicted Zn-dependent peptidase